MTNIAIFNTVQKVKRNKNTSKVRQLIKLLKTDKVATIGFHKGSGEHKDENGKGQGVSVITVAMSNHFGTKTIPARPFLDVGVRKNLDLITRTGIEAIKDGFSADQALAQMASVAVGGVQTYIDELKTPPNAPSTIRKKKGVNNPLVDTGQMKQSVTFEIKEKM